MGEIESGDAEPYSGFRVEPMIIKRIVRLVMPRECGGIQYAAASRSADGFWEYWITRWSLS